MKRRGPKFEGPQSTHWRHSSLATAERPEPIHSGRSTEIGRTGAGDPDRKNAFASPIPRRCWTWDSSPLNRRSILRCPLHQTEELPNDR